MNQFDRSRGLLGATYDEKLRACTVAVFGLGGVGSYVVEALARAGVGHLVLVDSDVVNETNINRQLFALHSTVGQKKADVAAARVKDICPDTAVTVRDVFFDEKTAPLFDFSAYDYVVDAIDTVSSKLLLATLCAEAGTKEICCLGTGNKLDAARFEVADVYATSVCPLARVMRAELKKRGIKRLQVVYSKEEPKKIVADSENGRHAPASVSFVPPVAGFICAGEVIKNLLMTY